MSIRDWFRSDDQPITWYQHAFFAVIIPGVVASAVGGSGLFAALVAAMVTSWFVLLYFLYREERHEVNHLRAGDWRTPDERGITPLVDDYGDLVGPVTAALCYTNAVIICWVVL